jgi:hypothetical protein
VLKSPKEFGCFWATSFVLLRLLPPYQTTESMTLDDTYRQIKTESCEKKAICGV